MAELKRNFLGARMNKDVDERILKPGEYRDANNIEISTSEGSDVGTVQNVKGNYKHSTVDNGTYGILDTASCVGSVASEETDKIYYFVSGGDLNNSILYPDVKKNYILEYDTLLECHRYVFVDIYEVKTKNAIDGVDGNNFAYIPIGSEDEVNTTGVRIGMSLTTTNGYSLEDEVKVIDIQREVVSSSSVNVTLLKITFSKNLTQANCGNGFGSGAVLSANVDVKFVEESVLKFNKDRLITGINILDGNIYWTDDFSEPKKINIERSILGTGGSKYLVGSNLNSGISGTNPTNSYNLFTGNTEHFHTRLVTIGESPNPSTNHVVLTNPAGNEAVYVTEKHVTVIKKAPVQPLELDLYRSVDRRLNSSGAESLTTGFVANQSFYVDGTLMAVDDPISFTLQQARFFKLDDVISFSGQGNTENYDEWQVKVRITSGASNANNPITNFVGIIENISSSISSSQTAWNVKRDTGDSLFQFKFPRFSYRYKYQDGEYSTFAPWSQIAFLPDTYSYDTKQGYNMSMINQVKSLDIKGYFASPEIRPRDISEIDILYKETGNPTVHVLRTLSPGSKGSEVWPNQLTHPTYRGKISVTSDNIYSVVPANQLLRPWDNVPLMARSQEISANRLIYGNYVSNFNVPEEPELSLSLTHERQGDINWQNAAPSVKSMREYSVGVVYSDGYGRETPVLFNSPVSVKVPKTDSTTRNRLTVSINQSSSIPTWAKYFSYYVKETSTEYYSLVMDRWYDAEDGNVWLSFPSSERNKVDENTFIKLKKNHGSNTASVQRERYKILSIENNAPDAVKKELVSLGTLYNQGFVGNSEEGYPLQGFTYFTVQQSNFEDILDITTLTNASLVSVRFGGSGVVSNYYKVSNVTLSNNKYKIELETFIDTDAAFVSTSDTFATAIDDLYIEFYQTKFENKPEFDGRFFVKINSDQALRSEVLVNTSDTSDLQIVDSQALRYVNNNGYVQYGIPEQKQTINYESGGYGGTLDLHPTEYVEHNTVEGLDKYHWGGAAASGASNSAVPTETGIPATSIKYDPVEALNGGDPNNRTTAKAFWKDLASKQDFFIDSATAYTFTGFVGDEVDDVGTSGTDNYFNDLIYPVNADYSWQDFNDGFVSGDSSEDWENPEFFQDVAAPPFGGAPNTCNMKKGKGLPSRGIWASENGGSHMDISWTGMGDGYKDNNWDEAPFPHMLSQVGGEVYNKASAFILKMVTPGTRFRFQNDPDSVLYTVVESTYANGANPYGYDNSTHWEDGSSKVTGAFGIRNSRQISSGGGGTYVNEELSYQHYAGWNLRQRWTIEVTPRIGATANGSSGYNPIHGTVSVSNGGPNKDDPDHRRALHHDGTNNDVIEIVAPVSSGSGKFVEESAIWETEPKEAAELDIYYQASGLNPLLLTEETNEEFIPIGSTFVLTDSVGGQSTHTVSKWTNSNTIEFSGAFQDTGQGGISADTVITFTIRDSYKVTAVLKTALAAGVSVTSLSLHGGIRTSNNSHKLFSQTHTLDWNNCWMFANGVESDRIRDDFNAPQMDNGVKASSTIGGVSKQERRKHGLIWSGIYNSASGINDTNQFIIAEKITKDINPVHGSIQKLHNRNTQLIMFCEDKVLKAVTNRDALYNADGNPQLISSNAVIGDVTAYQGDYGISKDPSSFAATPYAMYFTDTARGQVLRLTTEGIVSVSDKGMRDYFSQYMSKGVYRSMGSYDERSKEYNLTLSQATPNGNTPVSSSNTTISYSDIAKGWSSFKSFYPQQGACLNNKYYTFYNGHIWEHHHESSTYNTFYGGTSDNSDITLIVNDIPGSVKSFGAINYEGSQAKVSEFATTAAKMFNNNYASTSDGDLEGFSAEANVVDGEYHNLTATKGWYVDNITTDLQTSGNIEFKEKEGKWFGYPSGQTTSLENLNEKEFTVQGLGDASITHDDATWGDRISVSIKNNDSDLFNDGTNDGTNVWDGGSDIVRFRHIASVSTGVFEAQAGVATSEQTVTLEISNVVAGTVDTPSGYFIEASNFTIGNGNLSYITPNTGAYVWNGLGTNWNVSSPISQITISNTGTPGDINNTVRVQCVIPAHTFTETKTLYIDLDLNENDLPSQATTEDIYLNIESDYSPNETLAVTSDYTATQNQVGSSTDSHIWAISGTVDSVQDPIEVAKMVFTASAGYMYTPSEIEYVFNAFNSGAGFIEDLYTFSVSDYVSDLSGNTTSFTVRLYYNAPLSGSIDLNDPFIYNHYFRIGHDVQQIYVEPAVSTGIYSATWPEYVVNNTWESIQVSGSANTPYRLSLQKKTGPHSIVTEATNGYYNFETNLFQTDPYNLSVTTDELGNFTHWVLFPSVVSSTRYDLVFSNELTYAGGNVVFDSSVPTAAGDAIITNCGTETLTVKPITYVSANFGTLPSNVTHTAQSDCSGDGKEPDEPYRATGGNAGVSSTRLTLLSSAAGFVFPGMVVTGNGIVHNTTVASVNKNAVTLSQACTVANNTNLLFTVNSASLVPFSFTIVPNASADALSVNTATDLRSFVGGLSSTKGQINGAAAKTITHTLNSTKGIVPGMSVLGDQVKVASGTDLTVASVTNGTVIVLSEIQTFLDDTNLRFTSGNAGSSRLNLHSVQANKIGDNIVISGYINAMKIDSTAEVHIYIDNIITVA